LAPDLHTIRGDRTQIEQILLNLAANARDAMPEGGKLIIETRNPTLEWNPVSSQLDIPAGQYILLRVSDTGTGMDPQRVERVFEPFFTTKELGKGTGLGLASVYGIVRSHGGRIRCFSELGQGTTFEIHLPVFDSSESQPEDRKTDSGRIPLGTETILLVDDEPALRGWAPGFWK
jgi:two-component system cell cycle sensor histidine kinase/response regulator CckA